jgi:hypothetical protein
MKKIDLNNLPKGEVIVKNTNGETLKGYIYSWPPNRGGIFCSDANESVDLNDGGEYMPA